MSLQTLSVPHLGGTTASYRTSTTPLSPDKPTLVLIHAFMTSSSLYRPQFSDPALASAVNLVAFDILGHGGTRTKSEQFTYWDTAHMVVQAMEKLGVRKYFVLGTSQGGWTATRVTLLAPEKVAGLVIIDSSMDYESERSVKLGCWDLPPIIDPQIEAWTSKTPTPDFELDDEYCKMLVETGFGKDSPPEEQEFWTQSLKTNYRGDEGRRRARMALISLRDRDGLYGRLFDIKCPVLWLHGTADWVYTVANAKEEITRFVNSPNARLEIVEGGQHFLSVSHAKEVNAAVLEFVKSNS